MFVAGLYLALAVVSLITSDLRSKKYTDASATSIYTARGIASVDGRPFTGILYELYPSGDTAYIYPYENGKLHGTTKEWYDNRSIKEIRRYKYGRQEGEQEGWYADGRDKYLYHCKKDVYDGNVKEWLDNGKLYKDFNYKNGYEEGMQRLYWEDGSLRANYQVLNGRKYGLTGVKNCSSAGAGH